MESKQQQDFGPRNRHSGQKAAASDVALDQFTSVHEHLHQRLCEELSTLERRVRALRESPSAHSPTIISTYERMIRQKREFMARWGMDTPRGSR